jgi:predicted amidophosphoribosyltransferase
MRHDEQQEQNSNQSDESSTPLKQLEEFHHFMYECKECQHEVEPHWQSCTHCGARLATQCPGCGNPLPPAGAQSCPHCGLKIPREDA